jgi:hypothetical protein
MRSARCHYWTPKEQNTFCNVQNVSTIPKILNVILLFFLVDMLTYRIISFFRFFYFSIVCNVLGNETVVVTADMSVHTQLRVEGLNFYC